MLCLGKDGLALHDNVPLHVTRSGHRGASQLAWRRLVLSSFSRNVVEPLSCPFRSLSSLFTVSTFAPLLPVEWCQNVHSRFLSVNTETWGLELIVLKLLGPSLQGNSCLQVKRTVFQGQKSWIALASSLKYVEHSRQPEVVKNLDVLQREERHPELSFFESQPYIQV